MKFEIGDEVLIKMNADISDNWDGTSGIILGFPADGVAIVQLSLGWNYKIIMILFGDLEKV